MRRLANLLLILLAATAGAADEGDAERQAELDRRCAVAGVKLARRIAGTRAMQGYVESEYRPGPAARSDDDLL